VVTDFRLADVAAGGQGAPFVPLYHRALAAGAASLLYPLAVLNIGGVANITWIEGPGEEDRVIACDTGPGNALMDDWLAHHGAGAFDEGGRLAASGTVDDERLTQWLKHPYFRKPAPKSLDRDDFAHLDMAGLDLTDGLATLAAFTAAAVALTGGSMPAPPRQWLVTGGGRHNATLMAMLANRLNVPVAPVEAVGWRGDVLEAEAFAYLAVRSQLGLPLSLPGTTGVPYPMPGGRLVMPG
jgi:anhydro-N-acetylmuramic acid kinase